MVSPGLVPSWASPFMRKWLSLIFNGAKTKLTDTTSYGALGKGLLTGQIKTLEDFPKTDYRHNFPRFHPENFENNLKLVKGITSLAEKKGCTPGQCALGWLLAISETKGVPKIVPIPGASKAGRVGENAKVIQLTPEDVAEINALADFEVKGERYPAHTMKHLNG
jgi:pyridoxine 4-dehydrogenase